MKKMITATACMLLAGYTFAQSIGVGTTAPNNSAMLDVSSTNKGLLIPRMDSAGRIAISSPAKGLMVMDTSYNVLYRYNGKVWSRYFSSQVQSLGISSGTVAWDYERGDYALLLLTADISLSLQNPVPGMSGVLEVQQDATGNRHISFPPGSTTSSGGPASELLLNTAPNALTMLSFIYNGSQYRWFVKN